MSDLVGNIYGTVYGGVVLPRPLSAHDGTQLVTTFLSLSLVMVRSQQSIKIIISLGIAKSLRTIVLGKF